MMVKLSGGVQMSGLPNWLPPLYFLCSSANVLGNRDGASKMSQTQSPALKS